MFIRVLHLGLIGVLLIPSTLAMENVESSKLSYVATAEDIQYDPGTPPEGVKNPNVEKIPQVREEETFVEAYVEDGENKNEVQSISARMADESPAFENGEPQKADNMASSDVSDKTGKETIITSAVEQAALDVVLSGVFHEEKKQESQLNLSNHEPLVHDHEEVISENFLDNNEGNATSASISETVDKEVKVHIELEPASDVKKPPSVEAQLPLVKEEEAGKEGIEEIPSFSEWTEKMLQAERAKNDTAKSNPSGRNGHKLHLNNYASTTCGAKTMAANAEAANLGAILDSSYDDYMLSPCSSRVWFVVELCQAIQPKKIDLANFELFSSSFKEFRVLISERFPTKDWALLGTFLAQDQRELQSFDVISEHFGKFLKVEILSHYGREHYCPISLFRAYGTSEYEVLETENHPEEDFATAEETLDGPESKQKGISMKDAVINIINKAVETVAGTKAGNQSTEVPSQNVTNLTAVQPASPSRYSCRPQSENYNLYLRLFGNVAVCRKFGYDESEGKSCENLRVTHTLYMATLLGPNIMDCFCQYYIETVTASPSFTCPSKVLGSKPCRKNSNVSASLETQVEQPETTDPTYNKKGTTTTEQATILDDEAHTESSTENGIRVGAIEELLAEIGAEVTLALDPITAPPATEKNLNEQVTVTSASSASQKESVFVRLSNRIRTLERNMTLSVEYLEKLSKIYKRQVEELQKSLNRTLGVLNGTVRRLDSLEQQYAVDRTLILSELEGMRLRADSFFDETVRTLLKILFVSVVLLGLFVVLVFRCFVRKQFAYLEASYVRRLSVEKSNNELRELVVNQSGVSMSRSFNETGHAYYVPVFEYPLLRTPTENNFLNEAVAIESLESNYITQISDTASNSSAEFGKKKRKKSKSCRH